MGTLKLLIFLDVHSSRSPVRCHRDPSSYLWAALAMSCWAQKLREVHLRLLWFKKKGGQQSQVFNRLLSVSCGCMSRMLHMEYFLPHLTTTKTTETMQEQIAHDIPNVLDSLAFFPHFRKETLTSKSTPSPLLSQTQPSRCLIIHMQSQAVSDSIVRV